MMWERFGQLRETLLALTGDEPAPIVRRTGARILPFTRPD
jgi:hypothetical protein